MDFLEHIRTKPAHKKTQYAFLGATFVTLIIGLVWVSTLPARLSNLELTPDGDKVVTSADTFTELLTDTKDQFGSVIESMQEDIATDNDEERFDSALSQLSIATNTITIDSNSTSTARDVSPENQNFASSTPMVTETAEIPEIDNIMSPQNETTSSSPRVILIATTTSQNGE